MAVGVKTTPEQEALVVKLYRAGVARTDIADRAGIAGCTIDAVLQRNGVNRGRARPLVPADLKAEVERLCAEGKSNTEIGLALGITRNAVAGVLARLGIKRSDQAAKHNRSRCRIGVPHPTLTSAQANEARRVAGRAAAKAQHERAIAQRGAERKPPKLELVHSVETPASSEHRNISLAELTLTTCRWPIGAASGAEQRFCGRRCDEDKPYCTACVRERRPFAPTPGARELARGLRRYI